MKSHVLIIGTLPETAGVGGVTIHIERLIKWMNSENFPVDLCDYKKISLLTQIKYIINHKVVHIHASHPILRFFYVIICRLTKRIAVLTVHGDLGRFSKLKNWIDKVAIIFCNVPILINTKSFELARKWNKNAILVSAFIPPIDEGFVPLYYLEQIKLQKSNGRTIYCTNASAKNYTNEGEEIYGIGFLIDYFKHKENAFLVISDPSGEYMREYGQSFENILFVPEVHSFFAILKQADIMIRATATDGDSLSIKEALYLCKPTITTNRVPRPDGVILYEYNNAESLSKALLQVGNSACSHSFSENTVLELKKIYTFLLKK